MNCKNCNLKLDKRLTETKKRKLKQTYYYEYHYYCENPNCKTTVTFCGVDDYGVVHHLPKTYIKKQQEEPQITQEEFWNDCTEYKIIKPIKKTKIND